jgi:hypothetical protein
MANGIYGPKRTRPPYVYRLIDGSPVMGHKLNGPNVFCLLTNTKLPNYSLFVWLVASAGLF